MSGVSPPLAPQAQIERDYIRKSLGRRPDSVCARPAFVTVHERPSGSDERRDSGLVPLPARRNAGSCHVPRNIADGPEDVGNDFDRDQ